MANLPLNMPYEIKSRDHRLILMGLGFAALLIVSALTLLPVYLSSGWPQNHEYDGFYLRTMVYAQHLVQGDWLPIWSSIDNFNFGSAQPALYHKLFFFSAAILFVLSGVIKNSVLLALWIWLCIGGAGMYYLCRNLKCSALISWCGAIMLVIANYTVTDWLIRGAMGEFSAIMLVPWALAAYFAWLGSRTNQLKHYVLLGTCLGLIFLAHSVMAYYMILMMVFCTLVLILFQKIAIAKIHPYFSLITLVCFGVVAGPYLLAMHTLGQYYDLNRLLIPPFLPEYSIQPWQSYFWDASWHWGSKWDSYTVQLDTPILALLLVGLMTQFIGRYLGRKYQNLGHGIAANDYATANALLALWVSALILLFLQTHWAIAFYKAMPGANFLQFPWRLLGILTPVLIALALTIMSSSLGKKSGYWIFVCLVSMIVLCGAWAPRNYPSIADDFTQLPGSILGFNGVYVPKLALEAINMPAPKSLDQVSKVDGDTLNAIRREVMTIISNTKCNLSSPQKQDQQEVLKKTFLLNCSEPSKVPLPVFASPWHQVHVKNVADQKVKRHPCAVIDLLPGVCGVLLDSSGTHEIEVLMPSFSRWIQGS